MADAHSNFAYGTVTVAPSPALSGLSLSVGASTGALLPSVPFNATVWPTALQPLSTNAEIVRVTANASGVLTIVRSQEGSSARSILVGDQFAVTVTAKTLTDVEASVTAAVVTAEAYTDTAVGAEATTRSNADALKAPLASPALTGSPTAPTQAALDASTKVATTAYADLAVGVEKTRALAAEALLTKIGATEVFAAAATGTAATDTAVLAAAISATPAGGTLWIDGHYKINAALAVTQSITIAGRQKVTYSGLSALPSGPNTLSQVAGSIIEQTVAATDAITCTIAGQTFHARDFVLGFTNGLASTGHGFNCAPTSNIVGVYGGSINDCYVFGHDGNHYALVRNNSLELTTLNFRSWGGGGILDVAQGSTINYGNTVDIHPYVSLINAGTAHGFAHSSATGLAAPASGGMLNLMTYIRPQCNIAGAAGTAGTQKPWSDTTGAGSPWYVTIISPDFESSGFTNSIDFGPGTEVIGAVYGTVEQLNTRVGYKALAKAGANAGTQQKSVAVGNTALAALSTGTANAAIGYFAMPVATTGSSNAAVGYEALFGIVGGSQHVGIGAFAGQNATSCNYTTSVGYGSGPTGNTDGATCIGNIATVTGINATAIGYGATAGAAGAVAIGRDHAGTSATTSTQDEFVLGTALHTVRVPGALKFTRTEGRNFVVPGTIAVAAGATNYIPPMFVNAAGLTATLTAVRYVIRAGTSATFKVQKNGVDMTGFTGIAAGTTAATTTPTAVSVADGDAVAVVVTAVSGSPDSLTVELVFSYS